MKKVRPEELAVEIMAELSQYSQEVADEIKEEVKQVAEECVREIKAKSPTRTGKYKRGWRYKIVFENREDIRIRVYNSAKPSLTHLLEFGHATRSGGRVEGRPHIYPAEQNAAKKLEKRAKVVVRGGS